MKRILFVAFLILFTISTFGQETTVRVRDSGTAPIGKPADVKVIGDVTGNVIQHFRQLNYIFSDIHDDANNRVRVGAEQATAANLNVRPDTGGAIASAVPARAVFAGTNSSGNLAGLIACDKSVIISTASAATAQLVAISGSTVIYVCGYSFTMVSTATTAQTVSFRYGTGVNCATGPVSLTSIYTGKINATAGAENVEINYGGGLGTVFRTIAGQALCIVTTQATRVDGVLSYTQF